MRSGCRNLVLMLMVTLVATTLTAIGFALFFSFAAVTLQSPTGFEEVLKLVVGLMAVYFLIVVGRAVWRDLRGRRTAVGPGESKQEESPPVEEGER
jgi:O-antigen/teichoic acid export membrane protein